MSGQHDEVCKMGPWERNCQGQGGQCETAPSEEGAVGLKLLT